MSAPPIVVIGGANVDIKAHSLAPVIAGTSNPGRTFITPGGVGRNIAENLARLGNRVDLIAPIGTDPHGDLLRRHSAAVGIGMDQAIAVPTGATGTYLAVLEPSGELAIGLSSMSIMAALDPAAIDQRRELLHGARCIVVDGNVSADAIGRVLDIAADSGVPVAIDPVSVPKAEPLRALLRAGRPLLTITPNVDELAALVGRPVGHRADEIAAAAQDLHALGVHLVWTSDGGAGSLLSVADGQTESIPAPRTPVVDVTGAGDSATAAFVHALLRGDSPLQAARYGHSAAALTVQVAQTVREDLTDELITQNPTAGNPR